MRSSLIMLATAAIVSAQSVPPQPTVTAAAGSLPLGAECSDNAQCSAGAQCWASNSMLIRRCGNFNAACTSNQQCAYNTCSDGLCKGIIAPSGNGTTTSYPTGGSPAPTGSVPVPSGTTSAPGPTSTPTSSPPYTGEAASMSGVISGLLAVAFGVAAWAL